MLTSAFKDFNVHSIPYLLEETWVDMPVKAWFKFLFQIVFLLCTTTTSHEKTQQKHTNEYCISHF